MSLASANPELGYADGLGAPLHGTGGNSCLVVNSGFVFGPSEQWDNTSTFVYRWEQISNAYKFVMSGQKTGNVTISI